MDPALLGGLAALASAASWALGTVLWQQIGDVLSPLSINLNKCLIGIVYLAIVLPFVKLSAVDLRTFLCLGISGVLGIALADTFFFASLVALGSKNASVIGTLAPVFTALGAVAFLGERPSLAVWIGIGLTSCGVLAVLWERASTPATGAVRASGLKYALLSLLCMTAAVLLAKRGVAAVSPLEGTLIRLAWAAGAMLLWTLLRRKAAATLAPWRQPGLFKKLWFVVFVGTFGGFWLSLVALKLVDASVATTLNSTTPLFVLPLAATILKEHISWRAVAGAVVAVSGVAAIFMAGGW